MSILQSIIFLGVLVAIHEYGHFMVARLTGMKVLKFSVGFFKPIFTWTSKKTDIEYQLGSLPLGGYVQIKGMNPFEDGASTDPDSFQKKPVWQRLLVIVAGPAFNLLLAWLLTVFALAAVGLPVASESSLVGEVVDGGPADQAGIEEGDRVVALNGKRVSTFTEVADVMHESPGKRVHMVLERDGQQHVISVVPKANPDGVGLVGIMTAVEYVRKPLGQAMTYGALNCYYVVKKTLILLGKMIVGEGKGAQLAGPPQIVSDAADAIESGLSEGLAFFALISLMLFLFNLLPIPALDGGRIVFLLYEVITRRPVNKKLDATLNTVFFFLLMGVIVFVSVRGFFPKLF